MYIDIYIIIKLTYNKIKKNALLPETVDFRVL